LKEKESKQTRMWIYQKDTDPPCASAVPWRGDPSQLASHGPQEEDRANRVSKQLVAHSLCAAKR
jgi:hypothetical protein